MSNILDKTLTLCLNSGWQPIGVRSIREAILAMTAMGNNTHKAAVALDIEYVKNPDGSYNFDEYISMTPTPWEDWIRLPLRSYDEVIRSAKLEIRAPLVIIAKNYHKVPQKKFTLSKQTIYERDKGRCAYTGKKLSMSGSNLDHIISKDEWKKRGLAGSPDRFTNVVLCDPKVNSAKSNKPLKDTGLKLLITPTEPNPIPISALITEARSMDWRWFLVNRKNS